MCLVDCFVYLCISVYCIFHTCLNYTLINKLDITPPHTHTHLFPYSHYLLNFSYDQTEFSVTIPFNNEKYKI